ncbi:helix-turn-helix transcriptional regulator [Latilactobacillus fuchuensis]|uniref:helix-turn-helix transcriptional regulator n=1 Tax=Latilactobacillus fuchuensis TaxID=164393 RepID=UPI0039B0BE8E
MKTSRLVSIILILLEKKRVNAQTLSNMFEVSIRTIYRDIDAISSAGIPIISIPGAKGGFEIMKNYKIDYNVFSTNEIATILTGLSSLPNLIDNEALINTIVKMKSLIPETKRDEIKFKTDQIQIDLSQWIGYRNLQPSLEIIKLALSEQKCLSFDYIDHRGNQTKREVEPYRIVLKGNQWYFHGYCHWRKDFRLFKLSKLLNLELKNIVFTPRDYQKAQLAFPDILRTLQIRIKLRVHQSIMDRILDFCPYENCLPDGDEYFIVDFPFIENDYYYDMLLSFGNQCECLKPLHVRNKVKQKIASITNLYRN